MPIKLFEKYGAKIIGVWQTWIGSGPEVIYILAFDDLGQRDKFWDALYKDEEFQKYRQSTPRVANFTIKILRPTTYSPLR